MKPTGWVVWFCENMRDGKEEGAKCFHTLDAALSWINDGRWPQSNYTYQVFEMGKEVELKQEKIPEQEKVVIKERIVFKVKKNAT